ncbi:coniferyl aldehyde dehydrogenase [Psychrobacter sp. FDAARGOS_221]|uniref:coniferyl aldehyde dehydrogenase n=1 Tax=Psychrobacter sp. FDAARGOS_221 TaxID=1975705 RepID=UPI000BB583FF|nr:coniferyl aldehyde dehydrogenase [Psychrobacter sp. FDAARGOS_221]PNK59789.1 coniferyl aldehyde dehydrogenase [Psychrobacter sp. FDAARGOS_221]
MSQSIITTIDQLQAQFDHMRALSRKKPLNSWIDREALLDSLETMLAKNQQVFADAISQDFGHRSQDETNFAELFPSFQGIAHAKKHGKSWMKTRRAGISTLFRPAYNEIQPQPLGLVGVIAPWNYPIFLSIGPMIDALAAGNRVMIKMSESAPLFAEAFAQAVAKHFSPDMVSVVVGDVDIAVAFSEMPFDHLLYTGSTSVGRKVMAAAAPNLTPVTLELGGKSPVVVLDDADLENVVNRVMMGKTLNAGQTCIAPDYVLIHSSLHSKFVKLAKEWLLKHYPNIESNDDYTRIINDAHFKRLQGYLSPLPKEQVVPLTNVEADAEKRLLPPVIVLNPDPETEVMQNELFAPILPLIHVNGLRDAVEFVNSRPRPLALYIFGEDNKNIDYVRSHTVSGGVAINEVIMHVAQHELPFGGVGESGIGAYHGKWGFERMSHMKPVFVQSKLNAMSIMLPPYSNLFRKGLKYLTK